MPPLESLLAFFSIAVLLALSPGPDNIFVLIQSAQKGWRAGLAAVAGLCSGVMVHTCAVALGLAALIAASPNAFTALTWGGALYLLWLAYGAWRAPVSNLEENAPANPSAETIQTSGFKATFAMWARGLIMSLSNPKVLVFFLAFLPQFVNPTLTWSVSSQFLLFGTLFMLAALIVFSAIACFSGLFGALLRNSPCAQQWLNRMASIIFVGLAIRLLTLA